MPLHAIEPITVDGCKPASAHVLGRVCIPDTHAPFVLGRGGFRASTAGADHLKEH